MRCVLATGLACTIHGTMCLRRAVLLCGSLTAVAAGGLRREECRNQVHGYSGAEFRGFSTVEEARDYLRFPSPRLLLAD
jgi:hypothetical protein